MSGASALHVPPAVPETRLAQPAQRYSAIAKVPIVPENVAKGCAAIIGFLVVLHVISQIGRFVFHKEYLLGFTPEVYLGAEASIPNWFSTVLILTCGIALLLIAHARRGPDHRHWLGLGMIFLALSLDESAALHDLSAPFFTGAFTWLARTVGGPFVALAQKPGYAWMIPGLIFVAIVGAVYLPFLARLPKTTRAWFVLSGAVYVGGAVGFEALGGWYSGYFGAKNPTFVLLLTCEETLEMVGMSMFLYSLLKYAERYVGSVQLTCLSPASGPAAGAPADSQP